MSSQTYCSTKLRQAISLAVTFAASITAAAGIDDADLDGIADELDNCVLESNVEQRDTDLDGYGNRCDPDFNNDYVVNVLDLGELRLAFFTSAQEQDLNGDGIVNVQDLGILRTYFFDAPGPGAPDIDADGTPLSEDRCPNTPATSTPVEDGCSAFDIALNPERIVDIPERSARVLADLAAFPELGFFYDQVVAGITQLNQNIAGINSVQMCEAIDGYWSGFETLISANTNLLGFLLEFEDMLASNPPFTAADCKLGGPPECEFGADHTLEDLQLIRYQDVQSELSSLIQYVEDRGGVLSSACNDITGTLFKTGHVVAIDDEARRITLYNDDVNQTYEIGVVDNVNLVGEVYMGRNLRVTGVTYTNAAGIANNFVPLDLPTPQIGLAYENCALFRIAPYQRFAPNSYGPYELHHPDAYLYESGRLRLEKGMAFASVHSYLGCPDNNADHIVHYSQKLTLQFENANTGSVETRVLAIGLNSNSQPVPIPGEVKHGSEATLTVEFMRQTCPQPQDSIFTEVCSELDVYRTDTYELSVWNRETYCNAIYNEDEFELEYTSATEFRSAYIFDRQTLLVVPDAGTQMTIVAEGYAVNGSNSSYPALTQIVEGQPFALYSHDCITEEGLLFSTAHCGTTKASGLRWPRLTGVRNGFSFSYSCTLPDIIRDLRDYCPAAPNALYKFPFRGSSPEWTLSQGNFGQFTHNGNQSRAFDFVADAGTTIRAARRGTVAFVRENQTGNSYYDPDCNNCMANRVTLRHEDGQLTDYLHLPTNGAFVTPGQFVVRGQSIGSIGNTGFSTGPHLHFQARPGGSPTTSPVRFEALDNGLTLPPSTCWIPESGDFLGSDN